MRWQTLPQLHKRAGICIPDATECTPVVFHDKLWLIYFDRAPDKPHGRAWVVYDLLTRKELHREPWEYGLGCALVVGDRVHLFASENWSRQNRVVTASFDEHFATGAITTVMPAAPQQKIFNTSVTAGPHGYVMAYEVSEPGLVDFSVRFAVSSDLVYWTPTGQVFHPEIYAACPSIRYWNGYYYILYLRCAKTWKLFHAVRQYYTAIARTRDFETFQDFVGNQRLQPVIQVLSPKEVPGEGINNSDIDLVEYHGITLFVYADGDQQTWSNVRTAVFLGSMNQFFQEYWPDA